MNGLMNDLRTRPAHRLPLLHAFICAVALLGYFIPKLSFLMGGLLVLTWLDLPASVLALWFSMSGRELLGILCLFFLGTLEWYMWGRGIEIVGARLKRGRRG